MIYKTIDLCAGIGGIRRGFELTGKFENVLSAEIDEYACKTYEHLFGENPKNDLTSEEFKELVSRTEYDIRVMTPTEWGRLQGFIGYAFLDENGHETFSFPENTTRTQKYKQFGNSVTIPVIEEMALFMLSCFKKMTKAQANLLLELAWSQDTITRRDVIESLRVSNNRANYLLRKMKNAGFLIPIVTKGRGAKYKAGVTRGTKINIEE